MTAEYAVPVKTADLARWARCVLDEIGLDLVAQQMTDAANAGA